MEGLQVHYVRSAYSNDSMVRRYYLKPDVEKKALEVWGSWKTLKEEIDRRRLTLALQEETERRRRGEIYRTKEKSRISYMERQGHLPPS